jgi:asparagine synthase (glutamine-hydrolysing)
VCGIAGILTRQGDPPSEQEVLERMCATIQHRGPDDRGTLLTSHAAIGMQRLSVIDVDGGHQPISNEDGRIHVVYNGEIYNYKALRDLCESHGHRFSTNSDTEVLVHLYEQFGTSFIEHLNGMFAFALIDDRDGSALLARDRLGIKPLYYANLGGRLVFGSEIKAILEHPDVSRELDPLALDQYLSLKYIPAPRTIYRDIAKLPSGHTLHWTGSTSEVTPYWKLSFARKDPRPLEELAVDLRDRIEAAVVSQMVSDVPLGAFLSGGIDSSLIVAMMSKHARGRIQTFSIGFEEKTYNELDYARLVADRFDTDHHELVVRPDASDLFDLVSRQFDEPFGDASAIPTFLVSRLAREHVKVALSGTGADELFAGYERYWAPTLAGFARRLPRLFRNGLTGALDLLPSGHGKRGFIHRARRFLRRCDASALDHHLDVVSLFGSAEREALYADALYDQLISPENPLADRYAASDASNELERLLDVDTGTLLAEDYLTKDDRMSMATSLELRVPFLDHTLVEFAASCPPEGKLSRLGTKRLLKMAARDLLPNAILDRPKHGFELPLANWLAGDLSSTVDDLLLDGHAKLGQYLKTDVIRTYVDQHRSGHRNHTREIWALMNLEMWLQSQCGQSTRVVAGA